MISRRSQRWLLCPSAFARGGVRPSSYLSSRLRGGTLAHLSSSSSTMYYVLCIPLPVPIPDPRLLLESGRSEVEGERPAEARLRSKKEVRSQGRTRTCARASTTSQPASRLRLRASNAPRKRAGDRFPCRPGRNAGRSQDRLEAFSNPAAFVSLST